MKKTDKPLRPRRDGGVDLDGNAHLFEPRNDTENHVKTPGYVIVLGLSMESNAPEPDKENSWPLLVSVGLVLPILYILSIGPAAFLVNRYPGLEDPLTVFYAPVIFLIQTAPFGDLIIIYIEFFV